MRSLKLKNRRNDLLWGILFILPQLIGFLFFVILPVITAIYLCFASWDFTSPPQLVGFLNFKQVLGDEVFYITIKNTLIFVVGVLPLTFITALILALICNRKIFGLGFFKVAYFVPMVTSSVSVALVWFWLMAPDFGLINQILGLVGVDGPGWLIDMQWSKVSVILISSWTKLGYYFIIFLAGLKGVSKEYYEAADIDGANYLQKLFRITLPQLSSVSFFVSVMLVIDIFNMFDIAYILTRGGPAYSTYSLVMYVYFYAFQFFKMGEAAVASLFLFALLGLLTWIHNAVRKVAIRGALEGI